MKKYKQLTQRQRYTIEDLYASNHSKSFIARHLKVSVSTISRELKRNSTPSGKYTARSAQKKTISRKRANPGNRSVSAKTRVTVFRLIRENDWSPEQVSGYLGNTSIKVSKSLIYKWISSISPHHRDNIRQYLRRKGKRPRKYTNVRHLIKDRVPIELRPTDFGKQIGDLEMDTIVGKGNKGVIVTLVDKKSSFIMMRKLDTGKSPIPLALAVVDMIRQWGIKPRAITTDNGVEFSAHRIIATELGTTVYFANPYSSWEKGAIENANGLIRQYIPKGTDFAHFSHKEIEQIQDKLNKRPRKKNNFKAPIQVIEKHFH